MSRGGLIRFLLTFLAMASSAYAQEVKGTAASGLLFILTLLSVFIFICLLLSTAINIDMLLRGSDPILKFDSRENEFRPAIYVQRL